MVRWQKSGKRRHTAACEILIPDAICVDHVERPLDAFWGEVDVTVRGEGCRGDPEDFLFEDPRSERVWNLVEILDHGNR